MSATLVNVIEELTMLLKCLSNVSQLLRVLSALSRVSSGVVSYVADSRILINASL